MNKYLLISSLIIFLGLPNAVFAHQKTYLEDKPAGEKIEISNPDLSQAIYGELQKNPLLIYFKSEKNIKLNLSLLTQGSNNKNLSLELYGPNNQLYGVLDGESYTWKEYNADFDGKNYFQGPEFKQNIVSGDYYVKIYSPTDTGKFVLLIGSKDKLNLAEGYYSIARTTNRTVFRSNHGEPWGLLVIFSGLTAVAISVLIYMRKRQKNI